MTFSILITVFIEIIIHILFFFFFFFFNDTATTEIYTLSLHDALPICPRQEQSIPLMSQHIIWVEFNRALELAFCGRPVAIIVIRDVSERDVRLRQCTIDRNRFQCRSLTFRQRVAWWKCSTGILRPLENVTICQAAIGQCEIWILFDRLIKVLD